MALLLSLAIDAAEGLQFLHSHHIPHKNIAGTATFSRMMTGLTGLTECCAAASVMVSHGMRGMLSDFGLTRVNAHTRVPCPYGALGLIKPTTTLTKVLRCSGWHPRSCPSMWSVLFPR
jgi:serine/threonine protein kinase